MARCDSCNKFVSLDVDEDPQADDASYQDNSFQVDITRTLNCGDCGNTLKQTQFSFQLDLPDELKACQPTDSEQQDGEHEFEDLEVEVENTEDYVGKGRFQRRMLGVKGEISGTCGKCGSTVALPFEDALQVSAWDDA